MSLTLIIILSVAAIVIGYFVFAFFSFKKKMMNYNPKEDSKKLIILNDNTFSTKISLGVALVDFWAEWCQPCKIQGPIISELADDSDQKVKICKLDVDKNKKIAHKYGIKSIPTMIIFKNGHEVERLVGIKTKNVLKKAVEKYL